MSTLTLKGLTSGSSVLKAPDSGSNEVTFTMPASAGTLATTADVNAFDPDGAVTINDTGADVDFRVESDTLTHALFVQGSDGNVGIGTSSPNVTLTLSDGTDEFDFGVTTNKLTIKSVTTDGADNQAILIDSGNGGTSSTRGAYLQLNGNEYASNGGALFLQTGNVAGAHISFRKAGGIEAMRMDSSGNMGIGITPEAWQSTRTALQVGDSTAVWGDVYKNTWLTNNVYRNTSGNESYINDSYATSLNMGNGGITYFKYAPSGSADATISWETALTIDNSGRLIQGATSTTRNCKQYIAGDGNGLEFQAATNTSVYPLIFRNYAGNDVGYVVYNASSTTYSTSSDYRLKENVVPMTGSIDRLKELNPSRFNFIADADTTVDGFLAHEVSDYVPEAISGEKDAMRTEEYEVEPAVLDDDGEVVTEAVMGEREVIDAQGIDQSKLVPLLTSALQEAVAKIEELTTRIETLEAE